MGKFVRSLLVIVSISSFIKLMAADGDPITRLREWAAAEDPRINSPRSERRRREMTLQTAVCVFEYAEQFKFSELRKLCAEIRSAGEKIPYLKNTELWHFAKDFAQWDGEFKVRVVASIEADIWDKPKCKKVFFSGYSIRLTRQDHCIEGDPKNMGPIVIELNHPDDEATCWARFYSVYKRPAPDGAWETARSNFLPARDGIEKTDILRSYGKGFFKGYHIVYKFEAASMARNGFPVRLLDFLKRYGPTPEDLCKEYTE